MNVTIFTFLVFLVLFLSIGLYSARESRGTKADYLLASHSVKPWLVALSAVATNNSGYMFIGQIGFTYLYGLASIWLMFGWIIGDLLFSFIVHRRLRLESENQNFLSYGDVLSRWGGKDFRLLRILVGVIVVVFLGTYAAAQFRAGSKALHVLFGWDYAVGAVIGAFMVFAYCIAGGIRASIWTDAAQSIVMIVSMGLLLVSGVSSIGGIELTLTALRQVSNTYLSLWPSEIDGFGFRLLWVVGWLFGGFAVIGLPHVMIRFMALDDPSHLPRVRVYYYLWYFAFYTFSIGVGLIARVLIGDGPSNFDPELALPMLSTDLLPPILVGFMLAGLFSATMSTADSLLLSCTASITGDILPREGSSLLRTKFATLIVTTISLLIALYGGANVFHLVLISVSVLASAFGPLLLVHVLGGTLSEMVGIIMMSIGVFVALLWKHLGLSDVMYEIAPGMVSGLLVYLCFWVCRKAKRAHFRGEISVN